MKPTPIYALVDACLESNELREDPSRVRESLLEAVYSTCLNLENHHYLDRRMKSLELTPESRDELKRRIKYSQYAKYDFWRGVIVYLRWHSIKKARRYGVTLCDVETCFDSLTNEQYIRLLKIAPFKSTYRASDEVLDAIIAKAMGYCKRVAERQLRWIQKADPGFCGEEELCDEAIRVTYHYAHFPDASRIMSYVIRSIHNRANHLCEFHSADVRRRQRKLPEFRCDDCGTEFNHRKKVLTQAQLLTKHKMQGRSPLKFYCPTCAKQGKVIELEAIEGERVYETMVVSIDSQVDEDGRNLGEIVPDQRVNIEREVQQKRDLARITRKLRPGAADFVRILCDGDEDFEAWAYKRGIEAFNDPLVMAHLICEYKKVPYEAIQAEVGMVIGEPSIFVVTVDGEEDLICAQTPWEAVHNVARQYRFANGHEMQAKLGKVRVKRLGEAGSNFSFIRKGEVLPVGMAV